jgi:hypothetical protein
MVGFEVLTAASMKMAVFWVVAPCRLVEVYRHFRGTCFLPDYTALTAIFKKTWNSWKDNTKTDSIVVDCNDMNLIRHPHDRMKWQVL